MKSHRILVLVKNCSNNNSFGQDDKNMNFVKINICGLNFVDELFNSFYASVGDMVGITVSHFVCADVVPSYNPDSA